MLQFTISGEQDSTTLKVLSLGKRLSPNPKGGTLSWAQTKSEHNKGRVLIQVNEPQTAVTGFSNVTPSWLWLMSVESNTHWKSAQLYATKRKEPDVLCAVYLALQQYPIEGSPGYRIVKLRWFHRSRVNQMAKFSFSCEQWSEPHRMRLVIPRRTKMLMSSTSSV